MKVCVAGLWHLGCVTAACLASVGHEVVGYDASSATVEKLATGEAPISEPGLNELIRAGLLSRHLRFTSDAAGAVREAEVVWITYDTPVDQDDHADTAFVRRSVEALFPFIMDGTLILISSQLPVGSTRALEQAAAGRSISFAYSPENLRLGKAIDVFMHPDRVVAGARSDDDRKRIASLLAPITDRLEWMTVESAEMTKHALNAFLATSVAFINEIATICEHVGADAKEVERGLKSEQRIGPKAYLSPGGAFAGGTLARDIVFLSDIGADAGLPAHLVRGVKASNDAHRGWARRRLRDLLGDLAGKRIALWGLTYKAGTDTLRRSSAVELCEWLVSERASVTAYDPAVQDAHLEGVTVALEPLEALRDAAALVVMTEWPDFRKVDGDAIVEAMKGGVVLDANRFLAGQLAHRSGIVYAAVGNSV